MRLEGEKPPCPTLSPPLGWCCGNFISFLLPVQGSPASHCSRLLISLLLCTGVRVIGYFTRVRVELVEGKGQATRLSLSCTMLIHQLLSGTRGAAVALSRHFVKPHLGLPGKSINTWFYPLPISLKLKALQLPLRALENVASAMVGEGDGSSYHQNHDISHTT